MFPEVQLVAADPEAPLARRAAAALRAARFVVTFPGAEFALHDGIYVLLDDPLMPRALSRFLRAFPGRLVLPWVLLALEDSEGAGELLAESFRDVVAAEDLPDAVERALTGGPPLVLRKLAAVIEKEFTPRLLESLREGAAEKHLLFSHCLDLVRAAARVEQQVHRQEKQVTTQAIDEVLVSQALLERYRAQLQAPRARGPLGLPQFPALKVKGGALDRDEPRRKRRGQVLEEVVRALHDEGLLAAAGLGAREEMNRIVSEEHKRPLHGLRRLMSTLREEIHRQLVLIESVAIETDAQAALEISLLRSQGFAVLAPGIVLPRHLAAVIATTVQPPAEVATTWVLDLRSMRMRLCWEVLDAIVRDQPLAGNPNPVGV